MENNRSVEIQKESTGCIVISIKVGKPIVLHQSSLV